MFGYMPSEAARLVLGYLRETDCDLTENQFVEESLHLREYAQCLKSGYRYPTSIEGYSLSDILKNFYILTHLNICPDDDINNFSDNFMNILPILQRTLKLHEIKAKQNVFTSKGKGVAKTYKKKNNVAKHLLKLANKSYSSNNFSSGPSKCNSTPGSSEPIQATSRNSSCQTDEEQFLSSSSHNPNKNSLCNTDSIRNTSICQTETTISKTVSSMQIGTSNQFFEPGTEIFMGSTNNSSQSLESNVNNSQHRSHLDNFYNGNILLNQSYVETDSSSTKSLNNHTTSSTCHNTATKSLVNVSHAAQNNNLTCSTSAQSETQHMVCSNNVENRMITSPQLAHIQSGFNKIGHSATQQESLSTSPTVKFTDTDTNESPAIISGTSLIQTVHSKQYQLAVEKAKLQQTPVKSPYLPRQQSPLDFSKSSPVSLFKTLNLSSSKASNNSTYEEITPLNSVQPELPTRFPDISSPRYILAQQRSQVNSLTTPVKKFPPPDSTFYSPRRKSLIPRRRLLGSSPSSSQSSNNLETPSVSDISVPQDDNSSYGAMLEELIKFTPLINKLTENINEVVYTEKGETSSAIKDSDLEHDPKHLESNITDSVIKDIVDKTESDPVFTNMLNLFFGDKNDSDNFDPVSCMDELATSVDIQKSDENYDLGKGKELSKMSKQISSTSPEASVPEITSNAKDSEKNKPKFKVHNENPGLVTNPGLYLIPHDDQVARSINTQIIEISYSNTVSSISCPLNTYGMSFDSPELVTCVRVLDQPIMSTMSNIVSSNSNGSSMDTIVVNATAVTPVKIAIPNFHFLNLSSSPLSMPVILKHNSSPNNPNMPVFKETVGQKNKVLLSTQPVKPNHSVLQANRFKKSRPYEPRITAVDENDSNTMVLNPKDYKANKGKLIGKEQLVHVRTLSFETSQKNTSNKKESELVVTKSSSTEPHLSQTTQAPNFAPTTKNSSLPQIAPSTQLTQKSRSVALPQSATLCQQSSLQQSTLFPQSNSVQQARLPTLTQLAPLSQPGLPTQPIKTPLNKILPAPSSNEPLTISETLTIKQNQNSSESTKSLPPKMDQKLQSSSLTYSNSNKSVSNQKRKRNIKPLVKGMNGIANSDDKVAAAALVSLSNIATQSEKKQASTKHQSNSSKEVKKINYHQNKKKRPVPELLETMDVDKFLEKIHPSNLG